MDSRGRTGVLRRVLPPWKGSAHTRRRPGTRLRGPNRDLAEALEQLRTGVPLNWSQVEDDPQLITLASLQNTARECRDLYTSAAPFGLRSAVYKALDAQMPAPAPEPVKEAPKPLAGFSEAVPVLTQADEDVPSLTSTRTIPVALGAIAVVLLAFWAFGHFTASSGAVDLHFQWIELKRGDQVVSPRQPPAGWTPLQCQGFVQNAPPEQRDFLAMPDLGQAQTYLTSAVSILPLQLSQPSTYTLHLSQIAISPCIDTVPSAQDGGSLVKMVYTAARQRGRSADVSNLVTYQGDRQPVSLDVSNGTFKEVRFGEQHGVLWQGGPYRDMEGTNWIGNVSVMMLEQGDHVLVLVGQENTGINEDMLTSLGNEIEKARKAAQGQNPPQFKWIELRKGDTLFAARTLPPDYQPPDCAATPDLSTQQGLNFTSLRSLSLAQGYVGYPILTLPISGTTPIGYRVRNMQIGVRSCATRQLRQNDPGATVKTLYTLVEGTQGQGLQYGVNIFQTRQKLTTFDLGLGNWEEIKAGDIHGLYWRGSLYTDPEGTVWQTDVSIFIFEKDDIVVTMLGTTDRGVSKDTLVGLASQLK